MHPLTLLGLELGLADFVCLKCRYESPAGQPEKFLGDHSVLYMYRLYLKKTEFIIKYILRFVAHRFVAKTRFVD